MPKGHEFTSEEKVLIFRIIKFCEQEKTGPIIPLHNAVERISIMLDISERSVNRLKKEMDELMQHQQTELEEEQKRKQLEEKEASENKRQLRSQTKQESTLQYGSTVSTLLESNKPHRRQRHPRSLTASTENPPIPQPHSSRKKNNTGRPKVLLSEYATDTIRYQFHLLLQEKIYPTTSRLLSRLHRDCDDFPINSVSTLWREMKHLGFTYQRTSGTKIPLDSNAFVAARACYFRIIDKLRESHAQIYFHDESWCNLGEEKRSIWVLEGEGRIRQSDGKGKRIAVSALISPQGYHLDSIDVFVCSKSETMNNDRFLNWLTSTCMKLRIFHGNKANIAIVTDNAPWHNVLTPESASPNRSWRKKDIQEWLRGRGIDFDDNWVKAELLEQAQANAPPKEYKSDQVAKYFNILLHTFHILL